MNHYEINASGCLRCDNTMLASCDLAKHFTWHRYKQKDGELPYLLPAVRILMAKVSRARMTLDDVGVDITAFLDMEARIGQIYTSIDYRYTDEEEEDGRLDTLVSHWIEMTGKHELPHELIEHNGSFVPDRNLEERTVTLKTVLLGSSIEKVELFFLDWFTDPQFDDMRVRLS